MIKNVNDLKASDLAAIGMNYGYSRTRRHPSAKPFIKQTQNGIDSIDLDSTIAQMKSAIEFLKTVQSQGKQILFVGVKPETRQKIKEIALSIGAPYVAERFIGGTLTNYVQIKKRSEKLADLLKKKENGELEVYTKKEKLLIERDIDRLDKNFGGISNLSSLPGAIVMIDSRHEDMCVLEAKQLNIPVVAFSNTDCNLDLIDYPVVGNDASIACIEQFLTVVRTSLV